MPPFISQPLLLALPSILHRRIRATLKKLLARAASPVWAICGVANARNSYGYCCALRLAAHPKPGRIASRGLLQRRLRVAVGVAATATLLAGCGGGLDIGPIAPPTPTAPERIEALDTGTPRLPAPAPDPASVRRAREVDTVRIVLPAWDGRDGDGDHFDGSNPVNIGAGRLVKGLSSLAAHLHFRPTAQGTQVAAVGITSPQAQGVRLGLQIAQLPAGSTLRFYTPGVDETVQVQASEIERIRQTNLDAGIAPDTARVYWSPEFGSAQTVLEVEIPAATSPAAVQLGLVRVSHFVRAMSESMAVPGTLTPSCAIDVQCTPENLEQGRSVARISFVNEVGDAGVCSGTLLNDSRASRTPYFFTAQHCLENQAWASTLVLDWFFRSAHCGAGTLDPVTQRQHGGAVLLHSSHADWDDVAFLRLNQPPPMGVVYAGSWWGAPTQPDAVLTDVHHGAGDAQSFSEVRLVNYCQRDGQGAVSGCQPRPEQDANYWRVASLRGFLAGGSSGSGLFRSVAGKRYLIGALSGAETGYAACDGSGPAMDVIPETPPGERIDYFTRLDKAYRSALHRWLTP